MRIVIIGGGKVGFTVARQLIQEGHDIVVIDSDANVAERISSALDVMSICGRGSNVDILRQAGVGQSDLLIACTAKDETNLICCMFAKKLGCRNTIARVRSPEYAEQIYLMAEDIGLSMIVNPEYTAAREIFRLLEIPSVLKRDTFADGKIEIIELAPRSGDPLDGTPLFSLSKKLNCRVLVCAVQRSGKVVIPNGDAVLQAGDKVYICAPATSVVQLLQNAGEYGKAVRSVMLIGGSSTAEYLTRLLVKSGARVKIIEIDPDKARRLAEAIPQADIVCADGTSDSVLHSETVTEMDAVVTLTNIDEENLILSMYISRLGVPLVLTKVDHTDFGGMLVNEGVNRIISPKELCAGAIIRYIRAMQNTGGSSVLALHHLVGGQVDALEFAVTKHTRNLGKTLKNIRFQPNILIASINRNGKILMPGGDDTLEVGDTVVVITTARNSFTDLNDIFADSAV